MLTDVHVTEDKGKNKDSAVISVMVTLPERTDHLVTNETDFTPTAYESTPTPGGMTQRTSEAFTY